MIIIMEWPSFGQLGSLPRLTATPFSSLYLILHTFGGISKDFNNNNNNNNNNSNKDNVIGAVIMTQSLWESAASFVEHRQANWLGPRVLRYSAIVHTHPLTLVLFSREVDIHFTAPYGVHGIGLGDSRRLSRCIDSQGVYNVHPVIKAAWSI